MHSSNTFVLLVVVRRADVTWRVAGWRVGVAWRGVLAWRVGVACWRGVLAWRVGVACWRGVLAWRVGVACWRGVASTNEAKWAKESDSLSHSASSANNNKP
jgi:hypothetical protein